MKITILAPGSRGDVQPFVALGVGLQSAGYEVRVATHTIFKALVLNSGLEFFPVVGNPLEMLDTKEVQAVIESSRALVGLAVIRLIRALKPYLTQAGTDLLAACQSADVVIYSQSSFSFGTHIAEKLKVLAIAAFVTPLYPTSAFPNLSITRDLGPFNRSTWVANDIMKWLLIRLVLNKWREEQLKIPKIPLTVNYNRIWRKEKNLILMGFSPNFLPKPKDWGDNIHVTGYWFLNRNSNWQAPSDLVDFIASGPPPIYAGFGSLKSSKPELITVSVLKAVERTKQRAVLATGWGGLKQKSNVPRNVFFVESVPHDWLFPQMSAVIHHGAAGTTASGLKAGIPSIIVPFAFDQHFWGSRVAHLGVGPKPIPFKQLSVERLENAITVSINDQEMRRRAGTLGESIRSEDGVGRAVELIQKHLFS